MTKVLVVEDDNLNMELVSEILTIQGFNVDKAMDGHEAIIMAGDDFYDFILMDINLPVLNGIEASRRIKSKFFNKDIPIIALTAYALLEDKERILASGLDDYISKPVDIPGFIKKMDEYRIRERKFNVCLDVCYPN